MSYAFGSLGSSSFSGFEDRFSLVERFIELAGVDHDCESGSIRRRYRSVFGIGRGFGPIPKYYGQPVVIGAFSIITQNVRSDEMRCEA